MTLTSQAQTATTQLLPLAKELDENKVTPGVLGFIVFAALGVAVWMLMKSMHRHMNKVDFEERPLAGEPGRERGRGRGPDGDGERPEPSGPGA